MIAVIDFGMGNLHSCLKAISKFTSNFKLIDNPKDIEMAKGVILPGDGAFDCAMHNLQERGFLEPIHNFIHKGGYLFGICIGFQLLFEDSDEDLSGQGKIIPGLKIVPGNVRKFLGKPYKVPHMGWNKLLISNAKSKILKGVPKGEYMYFIHSYRPTNVDKSFVAANCDYYDEKFPVIVEKDNVFGTQFHPEKSDVEGLKILNNFIKLVES